VDLIPRLWKLTRLRFSRLDAVIFCPQYGTLPGRYDNSGATNISGQTVFTNARSSALLAQAYPVFFRPLGKFRDPGPSPPAILNNKCERCRPLDIFSVGTFKKSYNPHAS
jgi:hypothetical protein